jgi:hypothetical protein
MSKSLASVRKRDVWSAVERALAVALVASPVALLTGCPECSDDSTSTTQITTPPVVCDGVAWWDSSECRSEKQTEVWMLPDGGTAGYYEAKAAWNGLACADACRSAGYSGDGCEQLPESKFECTEKHDGSCQLAVPGKGRRPDGFNGAARDEDELGAFLVAMGELEDASVPAFRRLKRDLADIGAPKRLQRSAARAAREERRHTRAAFAFARRVGRELRRAAVPPHTRHRSIEDLARENAVEGCVHELHGAAMAAFAAKHARDPLMRAMMKRVAEEESSHAALGFELLAFYETRLDAAARGRVRGHAREAIASLLRGLGNFTELAAQGILPRRDVHARILASLAEGVWRAFDPSRTGQV